MIHHPFAVCLFAIATDGQPIPFSFIALPHTNCFCATFYQDDGLASHFYHITLPPGRQRGQRDGIPCGGECPTTGWIAGEVLTDTYDIVVEPGAPPGDYTIKVGWYDATTGQWLSAGDADHVRLSPILLWTP